MLSFVTRWHTPRVRGEAQTTPKCGSRNNSDHCLKAQHYQSRHRHSLWKWRRGKSLGGVQEVYFTRNSTNYQWTMLESGRARIIP